VQPFECGTNASVPAHTSGGIDISGAPSPLALRDKCVNVFVDCFDSLFIWNSSNKQKTINYVYELFNSVATGYFNDSVNVQITTINVWTTPDPYRGDIRNNALFDLANYWKDNFWGNICVGLDYGTNGRSGLAGDIGRIKAVSTNTCPAFQYGGTDSLSACCYCDMNYIVSVQNFPTGPNTTQQQVYLVMHEMGHLLGAHHTKWCGWKLTSNPDTYGTIDSCGKIERINSSTPPCPQGPPPPANGATIMSYCVTSNLNGNFVSYTNGFGRLPGAAIRNFINQSTCLLNCVDCFGWLNNRKNDSQAFKDYLIKPGITYDNGETELNGNKPPGKQPGTYGSYSITQNAKR
jgi:Metallo-peptidase family M12